MIRHIHLDEVEATPLEGSRWKPIRATLGIHAFGVNAYVADADEQLFAEHTEVGGLAGGQRHEELYLVVSGRALFTGDAKDVDAPAGTLVFVEDPSERRGARAVEDGTTVLAVGAPVGEPYAIPPWEYWFRVRRAKLHGDDEGAVALARECVDRYPEATVLFGEIGDA